MSVPDSVPLDASLPPECLPPRTIFVDTETVPSESDPSLQQVSLVCTETWRTHRQTGMPWGNDFVPRSIGQYLASLCDPVDAFWRHLRSVLTETGSAMVVAHNMQFDASALLLGDPWLMRKHGYHIVMDGQGSLLSSKIETNSTGPFFVKIEFPAIRAEPTGIESQTYAKHRLDADGTMPAYALFLCNTNYWGRTKLETIGEELGIPKLPMAKRQRAFLSQPPELTTSQMALMQVEELLEKSHCPVVREVAYCRRDVEILRLAWLDVHRISQDIGLVSPGITSASMGHRIWRRGYLPAAKTRGIPVMGSQGHPIAIGIRDAIKCHLWQAEDLANHGGIQEAFWAGKVPDGRLMHKYDFNSFYPWLMRGPMPIHVAGLGSSEDLLRALRKPHPDFLHLARVTVSVPADGLGHYGWEPIKVQLPMQRHPRKIRPAGTFTVWAWEPMLRIAYRMGWIVKIHSVVKYHSADIFTGFVDRFASLREEARKKGYKAKVQMLKRLMNKLYGKFGERNYPSWLDLRDEHGAEPESHPDLEYQKECLEDGTVSGFRFEAYPEGDPDLGLQEYVFNGDTVYREIPPPNGFSKNAVPAVAGYITSLGRAHMLGTIHRMAKRGATAYHVSTDCLILDQAMHPSTVGPLMGQWRLEQCSTSCSGRGWTFYCPDDWSSPSTVTIKGVAAPVAGVRSYEQAMFSKWTSRLMSKVEAQQRMLRHGPRVTKLQRHPTGENLKRAVIADGCTTVPIVLSSVK